DLSLSAESTTAEGTPVSLAITTALTLSFGDTAKTIEELVHADSDDLAESLVVDFDKTELKGVYNSIQFNQTFAGKYEHAGGVLTLRELITDLGQARIEGQLRAENLNQSAIVSGQFQTNRIDIPSLVKTLASDNDPGIRTAQTSANFDFRNNRLTLSDLNLALDDYRLQGKLSVDTQSPHNLDLLLSGDQISMPKSTPQNAAQSAEMTEPEALFTPLLAPLAALGDGKGHVELHLKHLSADNVNIDDFHLNIFTNQQIVRVSDLSGKLFGGAFKAAARIDLSKPKPTLSFEKNLTDIDVQAALSNLAEFNDLSGRLTLNFSGTATGDSIDAIQSTTSGQGNFTLTQPVVRNLNLEQSLCEATTALSDTRYIADTSVTSTEFTDIAGNLQMQSGKLGFDNIRTSTGNIHLTARGQVDSLSETVAIQTTANIRANRTSETGCSVNKRLVGVDIPVNCKGPLGGEIACRPDSSIIQRLLQSALLDEVAKRLLKGSSKDAANDSSEVPAEDQETATEETAETPAKKSDVEKAVETIELLRDIFKK
ncbi:MAG: AsmA family protein, partial [bacterium]